MGNNVKKIISKNKVYSVIIIFAICISSFFIYDKTSTYIKKKQLERKIENIQKEIDKLDSGDTSSLNLDDKNQEILQQLTFGKFVNQLYTDYYDIDITNNSSQYISGSLSVETYDEEGNYLDTLVLLLPSGGIPPNQTYKHQGMMNESEKSKVKRYKIKPSTLYYE